MVRNSELCCVPDCGKTRSDNVSLHKFPNPINDADRFRTWIYSIGGDVLSLDNKLIYKYRKVCHVHFDQKYVTRSGKLSNIAVPTLQLKGIAKPPLPEGQGQGPQALLTGNSHFCNVAAGDTAQPTTSGITNSALMQSVNFLSLPRQSIPEGQGQGPQALLTGNSHFCNVAAGDTAQPTTSGLPDKNNRKQRQNKRFEITTKRKEDKIRVGHTPKFCPEASTLARHVKKLTETKEKYSARLRKALSLSTNTNFQKAVSKFTTMALLFVLMQFREINKKKMGRRFTKQEKIMALSLYKQGPKAYRWLRHIFVLPSPLTLSRMISVAALKAGINEKIFENLKINSKKMSRSDKLCILLFDEMAIKPHFEYNSKKDQIIGFVDNGNTRIKKIADHALVFMIRGVTKRYKQPISYTFCSGSTGKNELAQAIKDHIRKLKSSGFHVVATVCDQGSANMSAINSLIAETKRNYSLKNEDFTKNVFEIDGHEVIPLYDPPHLIKNIRNNLITKNLICSIENENKTAKWEHIVQLYEENPAYKGIRLMPKLTEQHVNVHKIPKMKVKFATQLLSRSVAINMGYLAEKGVLDPSSKETADVILFFDELFDSVNGGFRNAKIRPGKDLLGPLTPKSIHHKVWIKSKRVLKTMRFVTPQGKKSHVFSIPNWLRTLENLDYLTTQLFYKHDIKSIWLRHFNQDPLENFFGCVRSHGARNNNPTCAHFEVAFAALLINNLNSLHSPGYNCEKDEGRGFKSLSKIFFNKHQAPQKTTYQVYNFDHISDHVLVDINNKKSNLKIMAQIEYVTGYILRKTKSIYRNCKSCHDCLYDREESSQYIKLKEYSQGKSHLFYPNQPLVECFSNIQDVVANILKTDSDMVNIKKYLKNALEIVIDFNFIKCDDHKDVLTNHIMDLSCRFFLHHWCKDTNNMLKGTRSDFDPEDRMRELSRNYYLKRKNNVAPLRCLYLNSCYNLTRIYIFIAFMSDVLIANKYNKTPEPGL